MCEHVAARANDFSPKNQAETPDAPLNFRRKFAQEPAHG